MRRTGTWAPLLGILALGGCGGGGGGGPTDPDGGGPGPTLATITVDAGADQRPISPDVYGVTLWYEYNWTGDSTARDMAFARAVRLPVNRHGGNGTSRYNWRADSSNAAADWFFMGGNGQSNPVAGHMVDSIIQKNRSVGAKTVVSVPCGPYVNKSSEQSCSYPVSIYGPQQEVNPYSHPNGDECGNGLTPGGEEIRNTDPLRNHVTNSPGLQREWIQHLVRRHGNAASGGVAVYELDNEPGLWMSTHRDVHPRPLGYHEQIRYSIDYAEAIKSVDPTAAVLGPTDIQWDDCWQCTEDGAADNGGTPLGLWYLEQMAAAGQARGRRLLDYFSEHYPGQNDADPVARAIRNIRQWREWIAEAYPGTRVAIDEYSWSADKTSIREGVLTAEGLGAFGREGVSLASYWPSPDWNADATTPAALAFRLFRSYDGAGGSFGETSVRAESSAYSRVAAYAALREADGALTLFVANKTAGGVPADFVIAGHPDGPAAVYQFSAATPNAIARPPDVAVSGGSFTLTLPGDSATMIVVP